MTKNNRESKSYCSYFWKHVCVRPGFVVKPCCRFDSKKNPNISTETSNDFLNHEFYKDLRAKAIAGDKIEGCQKCYSQEERGVQSLREVANRQFGMDEVSIDIQKKDIEYLEIFIGDVCNLKCVTCKPQLSTKWREDYEKLGWELEPREPEVDVVGFIRNFENLGEVKFVGGEPLIHKDHKKILSALAECGSENITLHYFTNNTIFPDTETLELWQQFKEVTLNLSVDGVGKINDYIRYPSKWSAVDKIVDQFFHLSSREKNIVIRVACTVSTLNVFSLSDLESWYEEKKAKYPNANLHQILFNPLLDPKNLALSSLSADSRKRALETLNPETTAQKNVINWIVNSKENKNPIEIDPFLDDLDRIRKNDHKSLSKNL